MDFNKLKDLAKTAVNKTAEGISKANEIRKKASLETKITLPAPNQSTSSTTVRKTVDGQYYIGMYSEEPVLYDFENFSFSGSTIIERTTTTGKTKQKGKKTSTIAGAALGTVLAPGLGTAVWLVLPERKKVPSTLRRLLHRKKSLGQLLYCLEIL